MLQESALIGLGLLGLYGIGQFVDNFLGHDKRQMESALKLFQQKFPHIDRQNKTVRTYVILYQKMSLLIQQVSQSIKNGNLHGLEGQVQEVRHFCLDHSMFLSKEVGERGLQILDCVSESIIKTFYNSAILPVKRMESDLSNLKKCQAALQELKTLICRELGQMQGKK